MSIRGALSKRDPINYFNDDNGKQLSDSEARQYLCDCLLKGWELIPMQECDNFCPKQGAKVIRLMEIAMADNSKIEWTDATWNVITGCSPISPGCVNCYASQLAGTRLKNHPSRTGLTREVNGKPLWTGEVRFNEEWLKNPIRWKKPRKIFVCAHSDLFHENVPDVWIDKVFAVMALCPRHTFQVLTKRPERMLKYITELTRDRNTRLDVAVRTFGYSLIFDGIPLISRWPFSNVWLGVTVENQYMLDERVPALIKTPAVKRFVSAEPLLGPLDFSIRNDKFEMVQGIDWIIVGGESGPDARPMPIHWARQIRDQCIKASIPFFFKQSGEWSEVTDCATVKRMTKLRGTKWGLFQKIGKKAAGRMLDGRTWDEVPE